MNQYLIYSVKQYVSKYSTLLTLHVDLTVLKLLFYLQ